MKTIFYIISRPKLLRKKIQLTEYLIPSIFNEEFKYAISY